MRDNFTAAQLAAVEAKGTVLVSAAAGSGKTSVLTERVIELLTGEEFSCSADRLLIVTFTNAAATEMRGRIESRINEECQKAPSNKRLLRQKILLAHSAVGTIDSFCMDLCRENFYDLQIDPNYSVINANTFEEWLDKSISQVLSEKYRQDPENYQKMLELIGSSFSDFKLKRIVKDIYKRTRSLPDPTLWLENSAENYSPQGRNVWWSRALDVLHQWAEYLLEISLKAQESIDNVCGIDTIGTPKLVDLFSAKNRENISALQGILECTEKKHWDKARVLIGEIDGVRRDGISKMYEADGLCRIAAKIDSVLGSVAKFKEVISPFFYADVNEIEEDIDISESVVKFIAESVIAVEADIFAKCKEKGMFTFDMIEHMALSLLKSASGQDIIDRYDWVLVDEYQDVNELQGEIFRLLSDDEKHLFMVGDVKQSIYGFRQADPRLFLKRKDSYPQFDNENYPSKIILDANFRSRDGICHFVNFAFSRLMSKDICGMDYLSEDSLNPQAKYPEREETDVEIHVIKNEEKKDSRDGARYAAHYIKSLVDSGATILDGDKVRPVRYGDFAILMRSPSNYVNEYIDELADAGIPVVTEKKGFWGNKEIITICSILQAVNNPCDDVALLAVLMSQVVGFTPDDLAVMKSEFGKDVGSLYTALVRMTEAENEKAVRAVELIGELRMIANITPLAEFINTVYRRLDYMNIIKLSSYGESGCGNLLRFLSMAAEFEKGENGDLASFCSFIQRASENDDDKSTVAPVGNGAVTISSIHGSKGLQYPICILARCEATFNYDDTNKETVFHEEYGIANDIFDYANGAQYRFLPKTVVSHALRTKLLAEELRLLYVAMTRAKEKLILLINDDKPEENLKKAAEKLNLCSNTDRFNSAVLSISPSYRNWIYMVALCHPEMREIRERLGINIHAEEGETSSIKFEIIDPLQISESCRKDSEKRGKISRQIVDELKRRVEYKYPWEELLDIAAKTSVTAIAKDKTQSNEFGDTPSFLSGTMLTPAQRGTALHKFMQFCDFSLCETDADAEAHRLWDMEYISETEYNALDTKAVAQFFKSELYARIKKSPNVMREQRFLSKLFVGEIDAQLADKFPEETVVIQGAADCLFEEDGNLIILDFKTDKVNSDDELVERYSRQLDIYAKVFSEIYGMPVSEKLVYSFKLGRAVKV